MLPFLKSKNRKLLDKSNKIDLSNKNLDELVKTAASFKKEGFVEQMIPNYIAVAREVTYRVSGKRPYDVQILGGLSLYDQNIIEMKTGEGKTLTVILPVFLAFLRGSKIHIATTNEYLSHRDAEELGPIYKTLGMSYGITSKSALFDMKKEAYKSDIIYGTLSEFGFDYLRDNMALSNDKKVGIKTDYLIVDEADSVLIDSAKTPLIIAGKSEMNTQMWKFIKMVFKSLKRGDDIDSTIETTSKIYDKRSSSGDYSVDELNKNIIIHESGYNIFEKGFKKSIIIKDASQEGNIYQTLLHYLTQYIYAKNLMKKDVDYSVKNKEVLIIDSYTGRLLIGQKFSDGLHQAIEVKEGLNPQAESITMASITYPELIKLYNNLAGMTGTAIDSKKEFEKFYNLGVEEIPTNRDMIRKDHDTKLFVSQREKDKYFLNLVKTLSQEGRPVLIGTVSVEQSNKLSRLFKKEKINHELLNALHDEKESYIVAQAGSKGSVTISTNMAGRGTDILLGGNPEMIMKEKINKSKYSENDVFNLVSTDDNTLLKLQSEYKTLQEKTSNDKKEIIKMGGLYVIGYERNESIRIDKQLRGRAGRQGDPGESVILTSLDDDFYKRFPTINIEQFKELHENDTEITMKTTKRLFDRTQKEIETVNYKQRENLFEYDEVNTSYRNKFYNLRDEVMSENYGRVIQWFSQFIYNDFSNLYKEWIKSEEMTKQYLEGIEHETYQGLIDKLTSELLHSSSSHILSTMDYYYARLLTSFQNLKDSSKNSSFSQEKPIDFYRKECYDEFDEFMRKLELEVSKLLIREISTNSKKRKENYENI